MKLILSKILTLTPIIAIILIAAYIAEEFIDYRMNEFAADLVYPIAAVIILIILYIYLIPTVQKYLKKP